jgi:putative heme-binding domain-containing protein
MRLLVAGLLTLLTPASSARAEPAWIWSSAQPKDQDKIVARTEFTVEGEVKAATLWMTCDNGASASLNNRPALRNPDWQEPSQASVKDFLRKGRNELLIEAQNKGGLAGLLVRLTVEKADGTKQVIESGANWQVAPAGSTQFQPATVLGKHGMPPWGNVLAAKPARGGGGGDATPADAITVPAGFQVELLYTVPKAEQGSWVGLTPDAKGRLYACDQYGQLYRLTPPGVLGATGTKVEKITAPVSGAHGLLWAHGSLYVMVNENKESGLYRLWDAEDDGNFERSELITRIKGSGEHGTHSLTLGADGKTIFFCIGNHTDLPEKTTHWRMANAWAEDHTLPRLWDGNGHARGRQSPGGMNFRMDPDGKNIEFWSGGFRNQFDLAVDSNGEVFSFDADMEWDMGMPWYRPTRINHSPSGSDVGWRSGAGKWPEHYPDSLPGTLDIGPGSPTGVAFGYGAKFPARYQRAFYACDWTYGTLYAVHLKPQGGGFTGEKEEFLFAKPLPLTDVVINPVDGAMYFAIGGRRTQSGVYRVTYRGTEPTVPVKALPPTAEAQLRQRLERLHDAGVGAEAIDQAWPQLSHADRFVRYAARVAIERQPVSAWRERALREPNPRARLEALIALARVGRSAEAAAAAREAQKRPGHSSGPVHATLPADADLQSAVLAALGTLDYRSLEPSDQPAWLRAHQLAFTRFGKPSPDRVASTLARLEALYPLPDARLNRDLCELLVLLDSPTVVARTLALMATARDDEGVIATDALLERNMGYGKQATSVHESRPNRQQIAYMVALRNATAGWTPDLRRAYFGWFPVARTWRGGNSFKNFVEHTRKEALAGISPEGEKAALDALSQKELVVSTFKVTPPKGPGRAYTVDEVVRLAEGKLVNRDYAAGRNHYHATLCATCHLFAGEGGNLGPDLTGIGNRYSLRDLAENIIEPSKVISDLYDSHQITRRDGSLLIGRVVSEANGELLVMTNPYAPDQLARVPAAEVKEKRALGISIMPPSLINSLNPEELLDLLAFLRSGGNAQDPMFKR